MEKRKKKKKGKEKKEEEEKKKKVEKGVEERMLQGHFMLCWLPSSFFNNNSTFFSYRLYSMFGFSDMFLLNDF